MCLFWRSSFDIVAILVRSFWTLDRPDSGQFRVLIILRLFFAIIPTLTCYLPLFVVSVVRSLAWRRIRNGSGAFPEWILPFCHKSLPKLFTYHSTCMVVVLVVVAVVAILRLRGWIRHEKLRSIVWNKTRRSYALRTRTFCRRRRELVNQEKLSFMFSGIRKLEK